MKIAKPQPFTFEGGERAVLLLHGFTGHSADVRMLARFLHNKGYTCHAPIYRGHGSSAEDILSFGPEEWWEDVQAAYEFLKQRGHKSIAAVGLSLGGVFSLKLGYTERINGIVPMCAPMYLKSEEAMIQGFMSYAREYKKHEGKSSDQIEDEMLSLKASPLTTLHNLELLIDDVRDHIDEIQVPTFVAQGRHDHMIDIESADIIYDGVDTTFKKLKWYEESGHAITFDSERDQLHEDVFEFLELLDW
ncbi:alpha/beta fold hydrolase [Bacillus sp. HMF5848]|nr:alpha/beta fold hydrolase [Bacillus sp. HMF5848]